MGTVGYMSPEQVRGRPADLRSDIFTFGAILYEMLSGKRAFRGDSAVETMNAILKEDPPELSLADQAAAPGLERIVRHCLEKNPEQRFQSTRDLAFDLESLSGLSAPRLEASTLRVRRRVPPLAVLAALLATLAIGLFAGRLVWKTGPVSYPSYRRLTFRRGPVASARFAPDGQTIVYAAAWDGARKPELFSVRVESPESLRLALPAGQVESISRSGEMLLLDVLHMGGSSETGTLSQTPLSGSAPRDLLEDVGAADWSPDGSALAVVRAPNWRYRLEFPVGKVLYETTGWVSHPRVSPKGDAVAFLDHPVFGDDLGSVAIVDRSGKKRTLSTGWGSVQGLAWSASGEEIWFTAARISAARALYAVSLSGRQRTVATAPGGMTLQDVSRDGRALFIRENAWLGFLGLLPGETKERDFSGMEWSAGPILSEDGKTVVFTEQGEGAGAIGLLRLPAQAGRFAGCAARRGAGSGDLSGRKMDPDLPHAFDPLADRAPADRGRRAEELPEGLDRPCRLRVRGIPSGRQTHPLRRPRARKAAARLRPGPRGRSRSARHSRGCRGEPSLAGWQDPLDPHAGAGVRPDSAGRRTLARRSRPRARRPAIAMGVRRPGVVRRSRREWLRRFPR